MANNYKGIFFGLDGKKFEVRIIGNTGNTYTDIELAGHNPFMVQYNTSNTPFEPVRTSTAQINVVHNDYMEDILSNKAQGTKIQLVDISNVNSPVIKWTGYLTPKIYDAGYEQCYETFQLEAADCISSLQYFDYEAMNDMGLVSFKDIIGQICNKCGSLDGFYWTRSKKIGSTILLPRHLYISERNFFSSDLEKPWKLSEVLQEVCRYLGFTCLQWATRMYFIDYQYLNDNDDLYVSYFTKSSSYSSFTTSHLTGSRTITEDDYRLNGATISFEPVYNKMSVKANMYSIEHFLPGIFDDALLINRNDTTGDGSMFYASVDVPPVSSRAGYPAGSVFLGIGQDYDWESDKYQERDQDFVYRYRLYDHKNWKSVYSDVAGNEISIAPSAITASSAITTYWRGGTIIDHGVVQKAYRNAGQQLVVPSKMDYTRYLCISTKHNNNKTGENAVVFKLKDGFTAGIVPVADCYVVINFSMLLEKYADRPYINPKWTDEAISARWTKAGSFHNHIGSPRFRFKIGNKYWNGTAWTTTAATFTIEAEWDKERKFFVGDAENFWNTDLQVLNNVSWEDELNATGYKIPLNGVDYSQEVSFEFINPEASVHGNTGNPKFEEYFWEWNPFCWIKDLSIDFIRKEHENKEENDIVYENVIDSGSTQQISDITCKITTDNTLAQPSYSSVAYRLNTGDTLTILSAITEACISNTPQKPEENIVEKYVLQYQTPTSKISLTLDDGIPPFQKLFAVDVDSQSQGYVQLGTEIDYYNSRQTMTCVEKKK